MHTHTHTHKVIVAMEISLQETLLTGMSLVCQPGQVDIYLKEHVYFHLSICSLTVYPSLLLLYTSLLLISLFLSPPLFLSILPPVFLLLSLSLSLYLSLSFPLPPSFYFQFMLLSVYFNDVI